MNPPLHSPEDKRLEVVSLPGPGSGCVTCSTSSALAESCTLKSKPPENTNLTDEITCSLVPHIWQIFITQSFNSHIYNNSEFMQQLYSSHVILFAKQTN